MKKKSNAPLVSVIIPVYNVAPYLEEALESIVRGIVFRVTGR